MMVIPIRANPYTHSAKASLASHLRGRRYSSTSSGAELRVKFNIEARVCKLNQDSHGFWYREVGTINQYICSIEVAKKVLAGYRGQGSLLSEFFLMDGDEESHRVSSRVPMTLDSAIYYLDFLEQRGLDFLSDIENVAYISRQPKSSGKKE